MYDLVNNQNYYYKVIDSGLPLTDGDMLYGLIIFADATDYSQKMYLGQLDLSDKIPHWSFKDVNLMPEEVASDFTKPMSMAMYNGRIYAFSDPGEYGKCSVYSLSEDGAWDSEPDMPCGGVCPIIKECNGKLYYMFGSAPGSTLYTQEAVSNDVYCFDGEKWEKVGQIPYIGRYCDLNDSILSYVPITAVKNGFVFLDASVDGGGNAFLYNTETNQVEPLYYAPYDSIVDCYCQSASCVAAKDGIYYIKFRSEEFVYFGYDLYLLPADSGAYQSAFDDDVILGDADGDGEVDILDSTAIQRHMANLHTTAFHKKPADADGDGEVTILDATAIQRWLAQLPSNKKIGKPIK